MLKQLFLLCCAAGLLTTVVHCQRNDDPFEYPDGTITEPVTVTHMKRLAGPGDVWVVEKDVIGCNPDFPIGTYAITEASSSRGFVSIYLTPDTNACSLFGSAHTDFLADEVPSDYWDNWKFEMTFSELQLNPNTELRLDLNFREVELSVDLAPLMRETIAQDTNAVDISGLFTFDFNQGYTNLYLNEHHWIPDLSDSSNNVLSTTANTTEPSFQLTMSSADTDARSLIVMTFLRVTTFGIPEQ
jgi:hypothetical protein